MVRVFRLLKDRRRGILLFLSILLILYLVFSQYRAKKIYEDYISERLSRDIVRLTESIQINGTTYSEILDKKGFSRRQAYVLIWCNQYIMDIIIECTGLAVSTNMADEEFRNNSASLNAGMLMSILNPEGDLRFDPEKKNIIEKARGLNQRWWEIVKDTNAGKGINVKDPSWVEIIREMDVATKSYLKEIGLQSIEELWIKRTVPSK